MTELQLITKWIERRPNGALRYPLAVRAHLDVIIALDPWALHASEIKQMKQK